MLTPPTGQRHRKPCSEVAGKSARLQQSRSTSVHDRRRDMQRKSRLGPNSNFSAAEIRTLLQKFVSRKPAYWQLVLRMLLFLVVLFIHVHYFNFVGWVSMRPIGFGLQALLGRGRQGGGKERRKKGMKGVAVCGCAEVLRGVWPFCGRGAAQLRDS